jgi:methylenetetrahydrofolate dehydrogenase (NADP+)/methenyltetrahydrofolate cyclohydrolase
MQIIDGKQIAAHIAQQLREHIQTSSQVPTLGIISASDNAVTASYVARKRAFAAEIGVEVIEQSVSPEGNTDAAIAMVQALAAQADGILVQLPLTEELDTQAILMAIPPHKDVDSLNPTTRKQGLFQSPVASAVQDILDGYVDAWQSQRVAIVGQGHLVGQPIVQMLAAEGVTVSVIDKDTSESDKHKALQVADIVISGVGVPGVVQPEMIREGVMLIDAGTATSQGSIAGDIDPACYSKASLVSPTPGGVGPIAVAKLFENLLNIG